MCALTGGRSVSARGVRAHGADGIGSDRGADRHSSRRGARDIEHIGSAHDDGELEALKAAAAQRLTAGQGELDLGLETAAEAVASAGPLEIVSSRMEHLWDVLCRAYNRLGFGEATDGNETSHALNVSSCGGWRLRLGGVSAAGPGADHRADQQA